MSNSSPDLDTWLTDGAQPAAGWDFSAIEATGRVASSPLPWSYGSVALAALRQAQSALDIGTGGGEVLARLAPFPRRICATEGYAPNVPIAQARLGPLGVEVRDVSTLGLGLPFADGAFDLVLSRHSAYDPEEVARVLRPGGRLVTQQVGSRNQALLNALLGVPLPAGDHHRAIAAVALEQAGLRLLTAAEAFPVTRYFDIGAVIFYLRAVPWQVPDFTVERYRDGLRRLASAIAAQGYLDVSDHRFFLIADRP